MTHQPHPDTNEMTVSCAVITVSDTRSLETDRSGQTIKQLLIDTGHTVGAYTIVKDEPVLIQAQMNVLSQRSDLDAVIFNGGTGIASRDSTYDAIESLLEKTLPGFGELFRWLSYQEIGSRAIAGIYQSKLVFSLPGSTNAVQLAVQKLILPELVHLVTQLRH